MNRCNEIVEGGSLPQDMEEALKLLALLSELANAADNIDVKKMTAEKVKEINGYLAVVVRLYKEVGTGGSAERVQ